MSEVSLNLFAFDYSRLLNFRELLLKSEPRTNVTMCITPEKVGFCTNRGSQSYGNFGYDRWHRG